MSKLNRIFVAINFIPELNLVRSFLTVVLSPLIKYKGVILDTNWNNTTSTNTDTKMALNISKICQHYCVTDTNDTNKDTCRYHELAILITNNC